MPCNILRFVRNCVLHRRKIRLLRPLAFVHVISISGGGHLSRCKANLFIQQTLTSASNKITNGRIIWALRRGRKLRATTGSACLSVCNQRESKLKSAAISPRCTAFDSHSSKVDGHAATREKGRDKRDLLIFQL